MRLHYFTPVAAAVFAVLLLSVPASAQDTLRLSLDKAISIALVQNRDVLIADQDRYKADAQIAEARSGAFPQLSFSGQYMRNIQLPVLFLPANTAFNPTPNVQTFPIGSNNSYQ